MNKIILYLLTVWHLSIDIDASPLDFNREQLILSHGNDINLLGETSSVARGDDLLTGTLGLVYMNDTSLYLLNLQTFTRRHSAYQDRIDLLTLGYLHTLYTLHEADYSYRLMGGVHFIGTGNYGGEFLQNIVHTLSNNEDYSLRQSNETKNSMGLAFKAFGIYTLSDTMNVSMLVDVAMYFDGSGYIKNELKLNYRYDTYTFWAGVGADYTKAFSVSIIEDAYEESKSMHLLYGASIPFLENYEIAIEGSYLGAPLGKKDDYSSYLYLRYYF
jgi:hypothetical protein